MSRDTIYALSTPYARSGVAVVRLSGPQAFPTVERLGVTPLPAARTAALRKLCSPQNGEIIDEALVLCFPSPHSFTGEDVAEFHLHGSLAIIKQLLQILAQIPGLRPAEAGEFARRALLNDKMDLTEIEGLADLIASETVQQKRQAQKIMGGALRDHYDSLRAHVLRTLAHLEAYIDFPDEEIPESVMTDLWSQIDGLGAGIQSILQSAETAQRIREGINVVVLGAPNAGKSSLVNALAKRDISIVSTTAGTTRDIIEAHLDVSGFPVVLVDTAGIREGNDDIEREGIARALRRAEHADIKLLMFDGSALPNVDTHTLSMIDKDSIVLISKSDAIKNPVADSLLPHRPVLVSANTGEGIGELIEKITRNLQAHYNENDPVLITRERHRLLLCEALASLQGIEKGQELEIICEQLRQASSQIGKITGRIMVDELLGEIFSSFCIGK